MVQLKIGVSLDNAPELLRSIVLRQLQGAPGVEVVALSTQALGQPLDVQILVVCGVADPGTLLSTTGVARLVNIDPKGGSAMVFDLTQGAARLDDVSMQSLLSFLRAPASAAVGGAPASRLDRVFGAAWRWLGPRPAQAPPALPALPALVLPPGLETPAPAVAPASLPEAAPAPPAAPGTAHDGAIGQATARLAARILSARAASAPQDRHAEEIRALASQLAAAAEPAQAAPDGGLPGLARAAARFSLREDECDLLLLAALVEVDPRAAQLVAVLNDNGNRSRPTVGVVQDLGGDMQAVLERLVTRGPLLRLGLASLEGAGPLATQVVKAEAEVWPLLLGMQREEPFETLALEPDRLAALHLPEQMRSACAHAAACAAQRPAAQVLIAVEGDEGVGRRDMALAMAAQWRATALVVPGEAVTSLAVVAALAREAAWSHAAVVVTHAAGMEPALWQALTRSLDAPLLAVTEAQQLAPLALHSARPLITVQAPRRDAAQRLRLWQTLAPASWPVELMRDLSERFDFGIGQIRTAVAMAQARVEVSPEGSGEDEQPTIRPPHLRAACEALREARFAGTAERMECPYEPGDIVLRPETQRELDLAVAWARHGNGLFGPHGAGATLRAGIGLACLFSGPPGGGKTMAAQIVARQVDYALYRVDLSQVVDKFIGESEKKLAAVFDEAERARVALFFDEADALFGKRTEVRDSHDRYANITVNYLLQRIETFNGLAILATNLASNIDDAFLRRMRIRATFPAPDAGDRRKIWTKLLPAVEARDADIDLVRLADPFELVGGEIRNAIYTAHLLAAEEGCMLAMRHCVLGLWRELGKTGRIPNAQHLGPWRKLVLS